jgi:hypothetical protein
MNEHNFENLISREISPTVGPASVKKRRRSDLDSLKPNAHEERYSAISQTKSYYLDKRSRNYDKPRVRRKISRIRRSNCMKMNLQYWGNQTSVISENIIPSDEILSEYSVTNKEGLGEADEIIQTKKIQ